MAVDRIFVLAAAKHPVANNTRGVGNDWVCCGAAVRHGSIVLMVGVINLLNLLLDARWGLTIWVVLLTIVGCKLVLVLKEGVLEGLVGNSLVAG